ncbi:BAG family molecular chaperone regulator 5 [Bifidobacterium sp. 82T24]|nr:BAG family molecular chaperone regulator 5 [Bifidobacterium pluvialisilvae]
MVFRGTERFDADGFLDGGESSTDPEARRERLDKAADDDRRILNELPPHWGKFDAEGRR